MTRDKTIVLAAKDLLIKQYGQLLLSWDEATWNSMVVHKIAYLLDLPDDQLNYVVNLYAD